MNLMEYARIEQYMHACMRSSAHDRQHVYRVLYTALDIAAAEGNVDYDVLMAACLLHDIGREQQDRDLELDHAAIGSEMAYDFLVEAGWNREKAGEVRACIAAHRYRRDTQPVSLEAKILFDADKLDCCGALGVARTLIYGGQIGEPLYLLDQHEQLVEEPTDAERSTFFQEYHYKLKQVPDKLYTRYARKQAAKLSRAAESFYQALHAQVQGIHDDGGGKIERLLESVDPADNVGNQKQ